MRNPSSRSARPQTHLRQSSHPSQPEDALVKEYANNSAEPGVGDREDQDLAWPAMHFLWRESSLARIRACRKVSIQPNGRVHVVSRHRGAGFNGLATCGSVHACPLCNRQIQALRTIEIGLAIALGMLEGSVLFGTFALPHAKRTPLSVAWSRLMLVWAKLTTSHTIRKARNRLGYTGMIRVTEVTLSLESGHPHIHYLLFFDRVLSDKEIVTLQSLQQRVWARLAKVEGFKRPSFKYQTLRLANEHDADEILSRYLSKSMSRYGRETEALGKASMTPWALLAEMTVRPSREGIARWHEYEKASKGKQTYRWSNGLRARFGLPEPSRRAHDRDPSPVRNAPIGDGLQVSEADRRLSQGFSITNWASVRRHPELAPGLLAAIGTDLDFDAGRRFCAEYSIPIAPLE